MIQKNTETLKQMRERKQKEIDAVLRSKCEEYAISKVGSAEELVKLSNQVGGLWYLPTLDEQNNIEKMLILKPITRTTLSYASTKIEDEGLYTFIEVAMMECIIKEYSDMDIMEDEEAFISAANKFQKTMEGKKTALLKR
jgi:hypothetical protein